MRPNARRRGAGTARFLVAPTLVTAGALAIRAWRLDRPRRLVFDEFHYVPQAIDYLHGRPTGFEVHPPLGKWLIAGGMKAFGADPPGWRAASLVFGSLVVALTYVFALRLLRSPLWATLAAALVAMDGLQIVQSRTAMLDIFLSAFVLAGALLAYVYVERRQWGWLAGAGLMFGAALAVKWSALPVIVFSAAAIVATSAKGDRRKTAVAVAGALVALPLLVYFVSYVRFWDESGLDLGAWFRLQRSILDFHRGGVAGHFYASASLGWLVLRRPVSYFHQVRGDEVQHIVALGNPALWWGFLASIPSLLRAWSRRTDRTADVVVLGLAALYAPWLLVQRTSFQYYLTPLVPFMAIGVVWVLRRLWTSSKPRWLRVGGVSAYVALALVAAALLLPVWLGVPISQTRFERLLFFKSWR